MVEKNRFEKKNFQHEKKRSNLVRPSAIFIYFCSNYKKISLFLNRNWCGMGHDGGWRTLDFYYSNFGLQKTWNLFEH
jgi:hypothetical protein